MLRRMGAELRQDFSKVEIEPSSREAAELGVTAFARGEQIHFSPGKYRPETAAGRQVLGHELTHVAQQRRGIVRPTTERGEHEVNDELRFEREADRIGSRAAFGAATPLPPSPPTQHAAGNVVQCEDSDDEDDDVPLQEQARKRKQEAAASAAKKQKVGPKTTAATAATTATNAAAIAAAAASTSASPSSSIAAALVAAAAEAERQRLHRNEQARLRRQQLNQAAAAAAAELEQRKTQLVADIATLTAQVAADKVLAPADNKAIVPPNRKGQTPTILYKEYQEAVEELDDQKPASKSLAAVLVAKGKIGILHKLTADVEALKPRLNQLPLNQRGTLGADIDALITQQEESEKNGLLVNLSIIYDDNIDFWEGIWGTSGRLTGDQPLGQGVDPVTDYNKYKSGATEADAIPFVWYKDPDDYDSVQTQTFAGTNPGNGRDYVSPKGNVHRLGLADTNRPAVGWKVKKIVSPGVRTNQKDFNEALKKAHFNLANKDGDHVKDLGFGGDDTDDNYWPLNSTINRRAFNGYNGRYVLHYQDTTAQRVKAKAVGGLIGKWFTVKDFLKTNDSAVPTESGKKKAGTTQV